MKKLLDLFCGAGCAAIGYERAGYDVTGVDLSPQPGYPYRFIHGDALKYLAAHGSEYDVIHASPPCQVHSKVTPNPSAHVDLIAPTRELLARLSIPWVIENVAEAPLFSPVVLCGNMFGLRSYRHRLFESNVRIDQPNHPAHANYVHYIWDKRKARYGTPYLDTDFIPIHGDNNAPYALQCEAMGIEVGRVKRRGLVQGIPPAFSEYIGRQLLQYV